MIFVLLHFMYELKFSIVLVGKLDLMTRFAKKGESLFRWDFLPHDPIGLQAASRVQQAN